MMISRVVENMALWFDQFFPRCFARIRIEVRWFFTQLRMRCPTCSFRFKRTKRRQLAFPGTLNPSLLVRADIFVLVDFATSHRKFIPSSLVTRRLLLRLSSPRNCNFFVRSAARSATLKSNRLSQFKHDAFLWTIRRNVSLKVSIDRQRRKFPRDMRYEIHE